jgi:Acetyltransferase (GNAT) family.
MTQLFMTHPGPLESPVPDLPAGFELRPATVDDAAALNVVLEEAFEEPWGIDRTLSVLLAAPDVVRTWVITTSDGRLVATASERLLPEEYPGAGYVHYVGALASVSGKRFGQIVTQRCLRGFVERGLEQAVLKTDDFRLPAVRTYLRIGFVPEYRSDEERSAWSRVFQTIEASPRR